MFVNLFGQKTNSANDPQPRRSPSLQLPQAMQSLSQLTSSLSLESLKSHTAKVSSSVLSSLKSSGGSLGDASSELHFPSILEQLKWPDLSGGGRTSRSKRKYSRAADAIDEEEESIVDKFVRVIQTEDQDEKPLNTFFNHPSRRRNDREEIRRRLAMGADDEANDSKKEPLQTRLQTGMNLQICFMNETASDCESQCSDTESTQDHHIDYPKKKVLQKGLSCPDFQSRQIQLQSEARQALSQAKDMARMQMEVDRQKNRCSPVTQIIRDSYNKIGLTFPDNKRRLSRQLLTDMNVAQLQVIVNYLHSQIENLNEELVEHLLGRDDYHMEQDSRLVDIEDLTNHLKAKESSPSCSPSDSSSPHLLRPK